MNYIIVIYIIFISFLVGLFKYLSIDNIKKFVECENINDKPLFDLIHKIFGDLKQYYMLGDVLVSLLIAFTVFVFYKKRLDVLEFIIMLLMLTLLKCITSMVTILPDPSGMCESKHGGKKTLKAIYGTCNDLMFSGHTGTAFLILLYLKDHVGNFAFGALTLYVLILCFITVVTHNHYTIDVIMSFFVAYFVVNALK